MTDHWTEDLVTEKDWARDLEGVLDLDWLASRAKAALFARRATLLVAVISSYEAIGRQIVGALHNCQGGPLVVNAYLTPEIEILEWHP